ncbi:MAG: glutamine--fructose-6-phosphate transaminase (isomerizing) [Bacilli bacterium]|nr:glutamine--fructose-6-phosphate transaminase (isomerizing) [Bacilli bacterium]
MCGIVGYNGSKRAVDILLDGLSKLEYRGYDSAGIAIRDNDIEVFKAKGKLSNLKEKIEDKDLKGTCGIGHTRWATHGEPSEVNAHPHVSNDGNVTLVHNGIIENYQELILKLERHDYKLYSETDTEVLANIIDYYYKKYKMGPIDAINRTMVRVRGSYAIAVMFKEYPDEIWVARKDSPMIIGKNDDGTYLASDVPAILKYTKNVYYIDNLEAACLKKDKVIFYDLNGDEIQKELKEIKWDVSAAEKEGYEHFMIKEINEQPDVVKKTINSLVIDNKIDLSKTGLTVEEIKSFKQIYIVACGSAYHVGVCAQYILEDLTRVPVRVEIASEFRYRKPILDKKGLVIVISQSGETADSLAALREAKNQGVKTLGIINVVGSSIAREADHVLYTLAGPEIAVATTKAFSTQLIACYALAIEMGHVKRKINNKLYNNLINDLVKIPDQIQYILNNNTKNIQKISSKFSSIKDAFYIGRGLDYAISLEGSLKLKEVSYIHSEAYAAGELKHGTISLIEDGTLVIGIATQEEIFEKTISNLVEVKSRGAYVIVVAPEGVDVSKVANNTINVPITNKYFYPSLTVVPLQLIGYYITISKGLDVDKPRNLAKSVTVE